MLDTQVKHQRPEENGSGPVGPVRPSPAPLQEILSSASVPGSWVREGSGVSGQWTLISPTRGESDVAEAQGGHLGGGLGLRHCNPRGRQDSQARPWAVGSGEDRGVPPLTASVLLLLRAPAEPSASVAALSPNRSRCPVLAPGSACHASRPVPFCGCADDAGARAQGGRAETAPRVPGPEPPARAPRPRPGGSSLLQAPGTGAGSPPGMPGCHGNRRGSCSGE